MSGAKHTPGPWKVSALSSLIVSAATRDGERPLAFVYGPSSSRLTEVGERAIADARLVAAAPDMLDALRDVLAGHNDPELFLPQVRAAIAKATGSAS